MGGGGHTLRLRRPLFCCCCCSMSSMAEAGGEAALMALTTLMLSSGSGGRFRRSRPRTFISWSSSKPPKVNWKITVGDRSRLTNRNVLTNAHKLKSMEMGSCASCVSVVRKLPVLSSRAAGGLSSWGSVGHSCCRTWSPW